MKIAAIFQFQLFLSFTVSIIPTFYDLDRIQSKYKINETKVILYHDSIWILLSFLLCRIPYSIYFFRCYINVFSVCYIDLKTYSYHHIVTVRTVLKIKKMHSFVSINVHFKSYLFSWQTLFVYTLIIIEIFY